MAKYELTFVFDKKDKDLIEVIEKMLDDMKAKDVKKEDWGVRKLAYPVRKLREAYYLYFEAEINPAKIVKLNQSIKLEERIIRNLIVRN